MRHMKKTKKSTGKEKTKKTRFNQDQKIKQLDQELQEFLSNNSQLNYNFR